MKRISLIMVLIAIAFTVLAYPVRIPSWNLRADVKTLNEARIGIDNVDHRSGVIFAYVRDDAEFEKVCSLGFSPTALTEPHLDYARELLETTKDSRDPMNAYYSIDEYNTFMQNIASQYPQICQLVSIGNSGQNRPLWYLKISDNVTVNEAEPEIRMVSSIHGDEVVGYDLLIRLIQLLTSGYNQDPRLTSIVNSSELWINPMYNPDGYVLQQRYNAAGYDLNRNFPMLTGEQHPDGNAWGIENVAVMNYSPTRNFSQSINYHGGALVINYPWDYTYTLAPDDAVIQQMALTYSTPNSPMYNGEFDQGITNGAAWYVITGSLQDWTYGNINCIDLTAEIGYNKWPPANQLDTFWSQNQESMLDWIEFAQLGLHGMVTDTNGNPLDASITIAGNSMIWHTDSNLGDYHRPILGGTYTVTANAPGYIGQTVTVSIPAGAAFTQNFSLSPAGLTPFTGIVRAPDGYPVAGATVTIGSVPPQVLTTNADGVFSIAQIYEGSYPLQISAPDYALSSQTLVIDNSDPNQSFILSAPLFEEDFENGISNWIANTPWAISPDGTNHVLKDSPSGNYANNINRSIRLSTPLALQNVTNPTLSLKAKHNLESGYDFVYVEASANGSTWTELASFTGIQSSYQTYTYSLNAFAGQSCHLRFRIESDESQTADGISIDDVQVSGNQGEILMAGDADGNRMINQADYEAVLSYVTGLDPLPQLDPLPWTAARIEACDVNSDDAVNSMDAYYIWQYMLNPQFRFPSQTGETITPQNPGIYFSCPDDLTLHFDNAIVLTALDITVGNPQSTQLSFIDVDGNAAIIPNMIQNTIALFCLPGTNPVITFGIGTQLSQIICSGTVNGIPFSIPVNVGSPNDDPQTPALENALGQNYPNPFNPSTTIAYTVKNDNSPVKISIFNAKGQVVKVLTDTVSKRGAQQIVWNGTDSLGRGVSSGVYYATLQIKDFRASRKLLLVK